MLATSFLLGVGKEKGRIPQRKLLEADPGDPSPLCKIQKEDFAPSNNRVAYPEHTDVLRKSDTTACRWSLQQPGQRFLNTCMTQKSMIAS